MEGGLLRGDQLGTTKALAVMAIDIEVNAATFASPHTRGGVPRRAPVIIEDETSAGGTAV